MPVPRRERQELRRARARMMGSCRLFVRDGVQMDKNQAPCEIFFRRMLIKGSHCATPCHDEESRHAIGWVIVGGMSLGTVLTLFVTRRRAASGNVPTAYTLLARDRARRHAAAHQAAPLPGPAE